MKKVVILKFTLIFIVILTVLFFVLKIDEKRDIENIVSDLDTDNLNELEVNESSVQRTEDIIKPNYFDPIWNERIEMALASTPCPDVSQETYPSSYYQGPLTDTHLHIPAIPDWSANGVPDLDELEGRFGGPEALLGWNVKMSEIACTIKMEGTHKNFAFFPVYDEESTLPLLEIWNRVMEKYP